MHGDFSLFYDGLMLILYFLELVSCSNLYRIAANEAFKLLLELTFWLGGRPLASLICNISNPGGCVTQAGAGVYRIQDIRCYL